jgi:hypothetical protein
MRALEAAIVLPQEWCISPARLPANEGLVGQCLLPIKHTMKQFAENLRLRDISRLITGLRIFPLPDGISGQPAPHLTILKA